MDEVVHHDIFMRHINTIGGDVLSRLKLCPVHNVLMCLYYK